MVYHVKFLVLLRRYSMLQYYHWKGAIDGWACLAKYWGPGPLSPQDLCPWYNTPNVATEHRLVRQDSRFSVTIYQWLSAVSGIVFQSLTVARTRLKLIFQIFAWQFRQNFYQRHSKEKGMLKILALWNFGAPFQPGALCTYVPCLLVNPALAMLLYIEFLYIVDYDF